MRHDVSLVNCGAFDVSIFRPLLKGVSRGRVLSKKKGPMKRYLALVREIPEVLEVRLADDDEGPAIWTINLGGPLR